jgi:hypothetical protein
MSWGGEIRRTERPIIVGKPLEPGGSRKGGPAESPSHRGPLWRPSAWNERRRPMFPDRALRRDAIWYPVSEACWMSGLREYGYAGLRDA